MGYPTHTPLKILTDILHVIFSKKKKGSHTFSISPILRGSLPSKAFCPFKYSTFRGESFNFFKGESTMNTSQSLNRLSLSFNYSYVRPCVLYDNSFKHETTFYGVHIEKTCGTYNKTHSSLK